jgi:hypothetical protein
MGTSKRRQIETTYDWQLLLPLFGWSEQERYEEIRPLVLFEAHGRPKRNISYHPPWERWSGKPCSVRFRAIYPARRIP